MSLHALIVRRITYAAWQRRRGGTVLGALARLDRSQWWTPAEMAAYQAERLRVLLAHAAARSPFYRAAFAQAGVRPEDLRTPQDLAHFPVLEKHDLREREPEVRTATGTAGLVRRRTSGSTGVPVVVWAEPQARDAWTAATFRLLAWWGVRPGDRRVTLISRHGRTPVTWIKQYLLANTIEYSAMDLSEATLRRLHSRLRRGGVTAVLGYPTSLTYLARYIEVAGGVRRPPRAVVTTGETLHAEQRAVLRRAFHCPVVDEYGTSETGHIAGECPAGRLHVAAENVLVETASPPARGGPADLLLTDLNNLAMPLIRYRIGDRGFLGAPCSCGRVLPVLHLSEGRGEEELIVLPDGRRMDFGVIAGVLEGLAEEGVPIYQYRAIQHAPDRFEVLLAGPDRLAADLDHARQRLLVALRVPVQITVRRVADIPPEATGKRRRFVSHLGPPSVTAGPVPSGVSP